MKEIGEEGRKDTEILKAGNSDEASEEHAKKPSIGVVDAKEENSEADEEKEGWKKPAQVVSRSDQNTLAGSVGIRSAEDGVEDDGLR